MSEILFVGGPANGNSIEGPLAVPTVNVPVSIHGTAGSFRTFQYTLRRVRDEEGRVFEILAPAGRPVDPLFLAAHKLKN
jgi:hypothetical protein